MFPDIAQQPLQPAVQLVARRVDRRFQVRAGMARLEDFQEIAEILNQGVLQRRDKIRFASYRSFETLQPLAGNATRFEGSVKLIAVSVTAKKRKVGFTNDQVIRRGVVMQLLVPLFEEMTADFLDVVAVHN